MAKALGSLIAAFLAAAVSADAFAVLNNDFTRANSTFMKRRFEESKTSAMQGRKARDADKKVEKKTFEDIGDVSYLREMKPHVEEGLPGAEMSRQRAQGNRENFDVPEYSGKTRRDLWGGADVPLALENTDRNLSKKYLGKIDVNKRDTQYQEFLRDQYAELMEMSMREINKFYFRESHSDEPGVVISQAGGKLRENDESFWDMLSPNRNIDRGRVFIKKTRLGQSAATAAPAGEESPAAARAAAANFTPAQSPMAPAQRRPAAVPQQTGRGELRAVETVDDNIGKQFDLLRVPDSLRAGRPTIKVEVKESE